MEVITTIRAVRQAKGKKHAPDIPEQGENRQIFVSPTEPLPPHIEKNKRCLNAVFLLVTYTLGFGSIILGAVHFHDCPANVDLPVFLVCFGLIVIFARFLNCAYDWRSIRENEISVNVPRLLIWVNVLFVLADIASFLLVCVQTFAFWPNTDPNTTDMSHYCNKTLYWTAFSGCVIGIVLFVASLLIAGYACCCYMKPNHEYEVTQESK